MAKYNEETVKKITDLLKKGALKKNAAIMAGIGETTFYTWYDKKRKFRELVELAIAEYQQKLIDVATLGSIRSPGTAVSILERRWPADWSEPKKKVEHSVDDDTFTKVMDLLEGKRDAKQLSDNQPGVLQGQDGETVPTDAGTK